MATLDSVITKLGNLLTSLNTKTGRTDATFNEAINALPSKKTADDVSVSGKTVTAPAGIYFSQVQGSVSEGELPTPQISVSSKGVVTATVDMVQSGVVGYIPYDSQKTKTYNLTTQAAKTVTPTASSQTAVASGVYTTGAVTVSAVPTETKTVTSSTSAQTVTPTSGKFLSSVTVDGIPTETKTATPTDSAQDITPTSGKVLTKVTVNAIPTDYVKPSGTKTISSSGTHDVKIYASASVAEGSATVSGSITANPSIATTATTIAAGKAYKMSVSGSKSITPTVTEGYIKSGTAGTVTVSGEAYVMESSTGNATTSSTTTTATRTIGYNQETTIGAGYYPSARIIRNSVAAGDVSSPSITVNTNGVITASATKTAGYITAGTASNTKNATALDSNLKAEYIKENIKIFGVTGSYKGGASVGTCTVKLGIGTMDWYTNNNVRVFYTSYSGGAFNTNVVQTNANATSTITLSNVVCGSAISVWTQVYAYISPSTYTKYTDEYNHCLMCPNSPGQTVTIDLLENS